MKKHLLLVGLLLYFSMLYSQEKINGIKEMPRNFKRYDIVEVDRFQWDTYSVLVITDCITKEKDYKLSISYHDNECNCEKVSYFSEGVVAELLKTFYYITNTQFNTQFEPELENEKSFIVFDVCENLYFRYRLSGRHLELFIDNNHLLAGFSDDNSIKRFASLLLKIEQTFTEKGRDLKNAIISDDDKKEPIMIRL